MKKLIVTFLLLVLFATSAYGYWVDTLTVESQALVCYDLEIIITNPNSGKDLKEQTDTTNPVETQQQETDSETQTDNPSETQAESAEQANAPSGEESNDIPENKEN